ncbi:MAG: competence/damage-inducible protein A [Phycisphaerae bacterium]|nr:competence/damage-inducible protein A [Phycisphaerae bacterium]
MNRGYKKAGIVSIGNELLNGKTVDTNAAYIAGRLRSIGVPVVGACTVGDKEPAIRHKLAQALEEADVLLITGGLGPTDDDLTRQAIAGLLGVDLVLHEDLLEALRQFFDRRGVQMPQRNAIQAHVPRGATAITNERGTAPGIRAELGDKILYVMPGVPNEMEHMLDAFILPELRQLCVGQAICARRLRCFGAGESKIAEMIGDAMKRDRDPLVNCTVQGGTVTLEIVATAADYGGAQVLADREEQSLRAVLGDVVFGEGDQTLAQVVGEHLARTGRTLAVAESCTGGLLASLITDVPGSSRYFTCGWITYSNAAKHSELMVPQEMLDKQGAVSEQVACAMARGARQRSGADYAIAITGIAGPGGGSEQKPVGLVYIAVDSRDGAETSRHLFSSDRSSVRLRAAQTALNMLRRMLRV